MLRKRTRSHQKDQQMGHIVSDVSDSQYHPDVSAQKHKPNSFFNLPGVFVGLSAKASELESINSPTSPLDFRVFLPLGNPFRSPRSSHESHQKIWGCSKVGLSIIDSLDDETKSEKVLRSSDSKNILFGAQMGIKIPNVRSRFESFEAPNSLPNNYAIFPSKHIVKPSKLRNGSSSVQFEIGEAPLEDESFGKFRSCSLDNGHSGSHLGNLRTKLSSGKFCLDNGTSSASIPHSFIDRTQILNSSLSTELTSIGVPIGTQNSFIGSLSASEIELSEDYTCVRTHGPNAKTTHIYSDCILECHDNELVDMSKNENKEIALSPADNGLTIPITYSNNFLSFCFSCKKTLEGEDIYMYRLGRRLFLFVFFFFSCHILKFSIALFVPAEVRKHFAVGVAARRRSQFRRNRRNRRTPRATLRNFLKLVHVDRYIKSSTVVAGRATMSMIDDTHEIEVDNPDHLFYQELYVYHFSSHG